MKWPNLALQRNQIAPSPRRSASPPGAGRPGARARPAPARHLLLHGFLALLAGSLLIVGCSSAPVPNPAGPRLSKREVLWIAEQAVKKAGFRLADYKDRPACTKLSGRDWGVDYEGRTLLPGNHLFVFVDDQTGKPTVRPGD